MTNRMLKGRFIVTASIVLMCTGAAGAGPADNDPWTKVPALPTACYYDGDPAIAALEKASDSISADEARQTAINDKLRASLQDIDPMELAHRMQQNMMKDPQNAAKYMQQIQSVGSDTGTELPETGEKENQIIAESGALIERYEAALDKANGPVRARWHALRKKLGLGPDAQSPGESGVPDWAWKEWGAILADRDRAYVATCPQWWGPDGQAHAYMQRYKDFLIQERVPFYEKLDEANTANYRMLDTPSEGYRSVASFEAAQDYIKRAQELFGHRDWRPICGEWQAC